MDGQPHVLDRRRYEAFKSMKTFKQAIYDAGWMTHTSMRVTELNEFEVEMQSGGSTSGLS